LAAPASRKKHPPTTGAALIAQTRMRNRWMAIGMAGFVITAFVLVMVAMVMNNRYQTAQFHAAQRHAALAHAGARQ
jgi:CBS-domain-containing membrane protein